MTLHIVKMLGGVSSVEQLREAIARYPEGAEITVSTRSTPTRAAEIAGQGSIYWCLKSKVLCRQSILDIRTVELVTGDKRCVIALGREVIDVEPRARKPFQGWRYLDEAEAPRDVGAGATGEMAEMPQSMREELARLGLL